MPGCELSLVSLILPLITYGLLLSLRRHMFPNQALSFFHLVRDLGKADQVQVHGGE